MKAHPGFEGAAEEVGEKEHLPMKRARAIIGAASHKASPAAIAKNPRLKRVPGVGKKTSAMAKNMAAYRG